MKTYLLKVYRKSTGERVWQATFKNTEELLTSIIENSSIEDFVVKVTEII